MSGGKRFQRRAARQQHTQADAQYRAAPFEQNAQQNRQRQVEQRSQRRRAYRCQVRSHWQSRSAEEPGFKIADRGWDSDHEHQDSNRIGDQLGQDKCAPRDRFRQNPRGCAGILFANDLVLRHDDRSNRAANHHHRKNKLHDHLVRRGHLFARLRPLRTRREDDECRGEVDDGNPHQRLPDPAAGLEPVSQLFRQQIAKAAQPGAALAGF